MFDVIKDSKYWYILVKSTDKFSDESRQRVAKFATRATTTPIHIGFKTKTAARRCAVDLNKKYWRQYKDADEDSTKLGLVAEEMVATVKAHLNEEV